MDRKKKYAQVGLGGRSSMFWKGAILERFADTSELVGVCDRNEGRARLVAEAAKENGCDVPVYPEDDFDRMITETKPDRVIVTTMDRWHDKYICRAMELGCDVITEKPMTIDEEKCRRILDAQRKTGKKCTVTFNYRYAPVRSQVKELLMSGVIGNILSVDFHWLLDTGHGADYFRRWHRNKKNSGGLLVHKATHHFDLVNWWLSDIPVSVFARGSRLFYTPQTAERYGLANRGDRCLDCPEAERCTFRLDLRASKEHRKLYLECEKYDGYFRDRCVFNPENGKEMVQAVDIEDNMHVIVEYAGGAQLSYSLIAYAPWEGYVVTFTGTRGRLQQRTAEASYVSGDGTVPGEVIKSETEIKVFPHWKTAYSPEVRKSSGGHGGADPVLVDYIFSENPAEDELKRCADQRAGAYSILCGVAANKSIMSGRPVRIDDLVENIGMPDYPAMPTQDEELMLKSNPTV